MEPWPLGPVAEKQANFEIKNEKAKIQSLKFGVESSDCVLHKPASAFDRSLICFHGDKFAFQKGLCKAFSGVLAVRKTGGPK